MQQSHLKVHFTISAVPRCYDCINGQFRPLQTVISKNFLDHSIFIFICIPPHKTSGMTLNFFENITNTLRINTCLSWRFDNRFISFNNIFIIKSQVKASLPFLRRFSILKFAIFFLQSRIFFFFVLFLSVSITF